MSEIVANVKEIQNVENLNIVTFVSSNNTFKMMSLGLNENIKISTQVKLSIKPSSVAIAKGLSGALSYSNQLHAKVVSIELGEILASVILDIQDTNLESIITSASLKRMTLQVGDEVLALIKSSDLSILEII